MIDVISASAGSGKTYRLAQLLQESVKKGKVRPEAIIATTFTRKAAAELQERTRLALILAGLGPQAQRLKASRIGTVNSICGELVQQYAYELGLPPRLRVIEEQAAGELIRQALEEARLSEDLKSISALLLRFDAEFDLDEQIKSIVDLARSNQLSANQLEHCAEESIKSFRALLAPVPKGESGDGMDQALGQCLEKALKACPREEVNKTFYRNYDLCIQVAAALAGGRPLPWNDWLRLSKAEGAGKKAQGAFEDIPQAASSFLRHPRFHADIESIIRFCFRVAGRALALFARRKRELGVIDFVDQETYALQLLASEQVADQLRDEIDLFLVDEFQDTSPIQLAIFMALSRLSKQTVWVGDQKQSIYAFRGTDPALMDAAMKAIMEKKSPETLRFSWRSREDLVRLTSALFAPAFTTQDIPEDRTELESKVTERAADKLGSCLEVWNFQGDGSRMNAGQDARCLAAGVAALLSDPSVRVRCPKTGEARPISCGDVAILCRSNDDTKRFAKELALLGIDAVLGRPGLLATPEGILMRAALALWVDARDSLAAAEIARILHADPEGVEWFKDAMRDGEQAPFLDHEAVLSISTARASCPHAGPVTAFDILCDVLDLTRLIYRWSGADQRLDNIDAFRQHLVQYAETATQEGRAATPAGALEHLASLMADEEDQQGISGNRNAVTLSTWHRAKGLEWPVTILAGLHKEPRLSPLGVHVVPAMGGFKHDRPLDGRWIRFWPNPFHRKTSKSVFHDRMSVSPEAEEAQRQAERQELRLLYVGWTRAKDRLVLAGRLRGTTGSHWDKGMLKLLESASGHELLPPDKDCISWAGVDLRVTTRLVQPGAPESAALASAQALQPAGHCDHPPARILPSSCDAAGIAAVVESIHDRLDLAGSPDMNMLGEAMHRFHASDQPASSIIERLDMAGRLLRGYGVHGAMSPADLVKSGDAMHVWIERKFPGAIRHHELPLSQPLPVGSRLVGRADLVLETKQGLVLIDHKLYPGRREDGIKHAASYAGQLSAYASALSAALHKPVLECWIHLAVLGLMVRVEREEGDVVG